MSTTRNVQPPLLPYARHVVQLSRPFLPDDPGALAAYIELQRPLFDPGLAVQAPAASSMKATRS